MSEPYSPNYLSSLGIEYIDDNSDFNNWDNNEYKSNLIKKKMLLEALSKEIKRRENQKNSKVKKRLFA